MEEPTHSLILAYNPNFMPDDDLQNIVGRIKQQAPAIETFITSARRISALAENLAQDRPSLFVSIGPLKNFEPKHGKVYQGQMMTKVAQLERLNAAKVPVPEWEVLEPNTRLNHAKWGKTVVLKPTAIVSSQGRGVQFVKTKMVQFISPEFFPARHPGSRGPLLAQSYVDTGEFPSEYRVLCFFGQPLYALKKMSQEKRPVVSNVYDLSDRRDLVTTKGTKKFGYSGLRMKVTHQVEDDVLELACKAFAAIPEAPLQGMDIVREQSTGKLYVLETNPGGFTWHFSSKFAGTQRLIDGIRKEEQMDAFSVAAEVLIERTLAEAQ
jgi:hypothetical protein